MGKLSGTRLKKYLEELGVNITETVTPVMEEGAQEIIADANSRIHSISGNLAASGHMVEKKSDAGVKVDIIYDAKADDGYQYARITEFRPGHEHPFLYPAGDAKRDGIREKGIDAIRKAVRKNAMP